MSSTPRSLVLGSYSDLPVRHLEPFVRSLRATGFRGSICVVAGRVAPEERLQLETLVDDVVDVDGEYGSGRPRSGRLLMRMRRTRGARRLYPAAFAAAARARTGGNAPDRRHRLEYRLEGLQALRYGQYQRYLLARRPAPDLVMISDLRDVVFQRDPFADPVEGLEVYLEDSSVRIGEDAFNTRWIRDLADPSEVEQLRGHPVSCSGTVVGTAEAMLAYLAEMSAEIESRRRPLGPRDQAVHNLLLHRNRLGDVTVVGNGSGRVLTMGMMGNYRETEAGTVLNDDGSVPAVLHQWDRYAGLVARIERDEWPLSDMAPAGAPERPTGHERDVRSTSRSPGER